MDKGQVLSYQWLIPRSFRDEVMAHAHDVRLAGNFGVARTLDRFRHHFRWKSLSDDVDYMAEIV
jgi:hypothetical protein